MKYDLVLTKETSADKKWSEKGKVFSS
jgi:hypothetical protein